MLPFQFLVICLFKIVLYFPTSRTIALFAITYDLSLSSIGWNSCGQTNWGEIMGHHDISSWSSWGTLQNNYSRWKNMTIMIVDVNSSLNVIKVVMRSYRRPWIRFWWVVHNLWWLFALGEWFSWLSMKEKTRGIWMHSSTLCKNLDRLPSCLWVSWCVRLCKITYNPNHLFYMGVNNEIDYNKWEWSLNSTWNCIFKWGWSMRLRQHSVNELFRKNAVEIPKKI